MFNTIFTIAALALHLAAHPAPHYPAGQPYSTFVNRQNVNCVYLGHTDIECGAEYGLTYHVYTLEAQDPSEEGYAAWPVAYDEQTETVRWLVGDLAEQIANYELQPGDLIKLWIADLPNY